MGFFIRDAEVISSVMRLSAKLHLSPEEVVRDAVRRLAITLRPQDLDLVRLIVDVAEVPAGTLATVVFKFEDGQAYELGDEGGRTFTAEREAIAVEIPYG